MIIWMVYTYTLRTEALVFIELTDIVMCKIWITETVIEKSCCFCSIDDEKCNYNKIYDEV